MKRESIHREGIMKMPNIRARYMKDILTVLKEEANYNTIIVGYFNIPLSKMNRLFRQKNE
jgi:hypothetical protein